MRDLKSFDILGTVSGYLGSRLLESVTMCLVNKKRHLEDGAQLVFAFLGCQIAMFGLVVLNLPLGLDRHVSSAFDAPLKFQTTWFWYMKLFQMVFFHFQISQLS